MNKKLALLLIPIMIIPMIGFAYAHFYDYVYKQYKIHVGSVEMKIEYFNITYLEYYDMGPECGHVDGVIDDEITYWIGNLDCTWYLNITIDPAFPGMIMETEMFLHNIGKLPYRIRFFGPYFDGPHETDPCWDPDGVRGTAPAWLVYTRTTFRHDDTIDSGKDCFDPSHYTVAVGSTGWTYCNSYSLLVKQRIYLNQDLMEPIQKDIECKWFRILLYFEAESEGVEEIDWEADWEWWQPENEG